jgi:hypothetical protein
MIFTLQKHREVIFLNAVEYRLRFASDVRHCFKTSSLQFYFQFGKQSEITGGQVRRVGRMGNDNHVVSHKLWFSRTYGRVRCRDEGASCSCAKVPILPYIADETQYEVEKALV